MTSGSIWLKESWVTFGSTFAITSCPEVFRVIVGEFLLTGVAVTPLVSVSPVGTLTFPLCRVRPVGTDTPPLCSVRPVATCRFPNDVPLTVPLFRSPARSFSVPEPLLRSPARSFSEPEPLLRLPDVLFSAPACDEAAAPATELTVNVCAWNGL